MWQTRQAIWENKRMQQSNQSCLPHRGGRWWRKRQQRQVGLFVCKSVYSTGTVDIDAVLFQLLTMANKDLGKLSLFKKTTRVLWAKMVVSMIPAWLSTLTWLLVLHIRIFSEHFISTRRSEELSLSLSSSWHHNSKSNASSHGSSRPFGG